MTYPNLKKAEEYGATGKYKTMPVSMELYADMYTPVGILKKLKCISEHCYMLESAEDAKQWGRYSFLGFDPSMGISCRNRKVYIREAGKEKECEVSHPAEIIRQIVEGHKAPVVEGLPPFTGGLVGYFAYDYMKYVEPVLELNVEAESHFQDLDLMLFEQVIVFDHLRQKLILIVNMHLDRNVTEEYQKAEQQLLVLKEIVEGPAVLKAFPLVLKSGFSPRFTEVEYGEMVQHAKQFIQEGEIFQVVLANRMEAEIEGSILDVYRALRTENPSPYMFYFSGSEIELAGASPETLVKVKEGTVHTFPLAGTRKRGATEEEDLLLEKELLSDEKEVAEHTMLVDLGRNDLGKISKIGTVELETFMSIERFSHVMHIGSTVRGEMRQDKDYMDAVDAVLPAGTLSGAPKIRACQIISKLEGCKRGIYGGAVGYIDFTGNIDTCIGIRMAYAKENRLYVCSGAGIVADSVPKTEHQECMNKARAVIRAVETAGRGMKL